MNSEPQKSPAHGSASVDRYDAIIIGAGMAGMYQLFRLRELGLSVRVFETGAGVGGTWYWNRYPGARFDSESYTYGYSFDEKLLQEWNWSEHFSAAARDTALPRTTSRTGFDLRRDIRVQQPRHSAVFDETRRASGRSQPRDGRRCAGPPPDHRGRYRCPPPTLPRIDGINSFKGQAFHTARWPHEPVDFTGKRVGVIGTGATGVQVIQEIAKTAGHLTVFQRTPNCCTPLHNRPIDDETQRRIKASYPEIFAKCRGTFAGFLHDTDPRSTLEVSEEEREAFWEKLYRDPGFAMWLGNFRDILFNQEANDLVSEFVRKKIRQRVQDPETAKKLIPQNHGFGTRRVPQETGYYEVYNQDHVDAGRPARDADRAHHRDRHSNSATPSTSSTSSSTPQASMPSPERSTASTFAGAGGLKLKDKWADGPRTYLGLQGVGFPNFLTLVGPHNAAVSATSRAASSRTWSGLRIWPATCTKTDTRE